MGRGQSKTMVILVCSVPLGLAALMVGANVALAAALARLFGGAGLTPASGGSGIGFWAAYFGALALANAPALAVFGAWLRAEDRERVARTEVLRAMRWSTHLDRWQPRLWPDVPAPAPSPASSASIRPAVARHRHLAYLARFVCALAGPVALLGMLAAR